MSDEVFDFFWEVREEGYQWLVTTLASPDPKGGEKPTPAPWLTSGQPLGGAGYMVRRYNPLRQEPALFRAFAELAPTQEAILAFANSYGMLGGDNSIMIVLPPEEPGSPAKMGSGESLRGWRLEVDAMRKALWLWDKAAAGDVAALSEVISWPSKQEVRYDRFIPVEGRARPRWEFDPIAAENYRPELLERFTHGDLIEPAQVLVQRLVNKHLQGRVSPRLLWNLEVGRLQLYIVPNSFIGALWLQFAQMVNGNRKYRRCVTCGKWFELTPEVARTNKLYCSNACRSKYYRDRQAEAHRLHADGMSPEAIAERLESEPEVVRGWLARPKPTGRKRGRPRKR